MIGDFVRALFRRMGWRAWATVWLALAVSLFEAASMLLLVPLLNLAGVPVGAGASGRVVQAIGRAFAAVHLPVTLPSVLGAFVAAVAVRAALGSLLAVMRVQVQEGLSATLRREVYHAIFRARWEFFVRTRASDLAHVLTAEANRAGFAALNLVMVLTDALVAAVYVALAARISPVFTAVAVAAGAVLLLALRRIAARSHGQGVAVSERGAELYAAVGEHLAGVKTAKGFGAEERHEQHFAGVSERLARAGVQVTRYYAEAEFWRQVGSAVILSAVLLVAVARLRLPPAEVLLLLFLFSRIVPRVSAVQGGFQRFTSELPGYGQVAAMVERCRAEAEPGGAAPAPPLERELRLDGVSFRYRGAAVPALAGASLAVPAGRTTAVVGPSGAGKSTLVDLVIGLLSPDEGAVRVDGQALDPAQLAAWRSGIGYVPQDTFLFHDSVRANLLWARPEATDAELREALRLASADAFVGALPHGLDTVVGDRGARLSGGERQRIALARALLRRPRLLVLDEATSALDAENEERIMDAISQLHGALTILIVTHRLATVRHADLIHVLDGGRVAESGGWDALMRTGGRLRALYEAQQRSARVASTHHDLVSAREADDLLR